MGQPLRPYVTAGVALVGAGLIAVPSAAPPLPHVQIRDIQLIDTAESPLGDGAGLVFDGSGGGIPAPRMVDATNAPYLQPLGCTGTAHPGFMPDLLYPLTGIKTL